MKKRISFSRLLHHDKLMMLVSLLLAILIWALVVYGPGNNEERELTGVPVSITLNDCVLSAGSLPPRPCGCGVPVLN